jgi:hypothetical protein
MPERKNDMSVDIGFEDVDLPDVRMPGFTFTATHKPRPYRIGVTTYL